MISSSTSPGSGSRDVVKPSTSSGVASDAQPAGVVARSSTPTLGAGRPRTAVAPAASLRPGASWLRPRGRRRPPGSQRTARRNGGAPGPRHAAAASDAPGQRLRRGATAPATSTCAETSSPPSKPAIAPSRAMRDGLGPSGSSADTPFARRRRSRTSSHTRRQRRRRCSGVINRSSVQERPMDM